MTVAAPICPPCNVAMEYHHGFLGYESFVCPKCGVDINDMKTQQEPEPPQGAKGPEGVKGPEGPHGIPVSPELFWRVMAQVEAMRPPPVQYGWFDRLILRLRKR